MKKSLQILFGLVLILVLAYVAFLDVSTKIKDDLLTKAKVIFSEHNVKSVTANIQGEGLTLSRTLVLDGTVISDEERIEIIKLTENIEGICSIDNRIKLEVISKSPLVPIVAKVPIVTEVPLVEKVSEEMVTKDTPKEPVVTKIVTEVPVAKKTVVEPMEKKEATITSTATVTKIPLVPVIKTKTVTISLTPNTTNTKIPMTPVVEAKTAITSVSSTKITTTVPSVPSVGNKSIIVPTPVTVISVPKVIEVEKMKLEGVK